MSKEGLQFFTESPLAILKRGLNKSFRLTAAASLFLTACATSVNAEGDDKPVEPTRAGEMTSTIAPTAIPATPESSPTATPDILNIPMEQVAQLLAEGKVEYPADWEDGKKHELAVAFAEYLNSITADEAYVPMHFDQVGDIKVGWDPITKKWRSDHNTPEGSLDFSGDSLPELVVPGYTNAAGQEVIIDPETGSERIVPEINMPELGEVSITELYAMGQSDLINYTLDLMLGANKIDDIAKEYIESRRNNSFALPVILAENALENDPIYSIMSRGGAAPISIPEVPRNFRETRTNGALIPFFDPNSGEIMLWLKIQQGTVVTRSHSFSFSSGINPTWIYTSGDKDPRSFGNNSNHSFGLLFPATTTEGAYDIQSSEPLLETGAGIGDAQEIMRILNSGSTEELVKLLLELRLIVLYPDIEIHQE